MVWIKITMGAIFIIAIFIGIAFVPASCMSDNTTIDEWMQDHTVNVNSTTTCKYEQGQLLIKEVYTGEELKERFGVEQFTKELKIPVEAEVLAEGKLRGMQEGEEKVFVTEKVTVLTSGDDPPQWWDEYKYPQWVWFKSGDIYERRLPINLAWKNTTKDTAKSEILEEGWVDNPIQYTEYVYDPIDGWIIGDGVATDKYGIFGRYHVNLWQMFDENVVANAHHDCSVIPFGHEADELEEAEELVAGFFNQPEDTEWNAYEDNYWLDNYVSSPYSNGWCTQISYGSATWYVPDDYLKIQWAVDNATAGDTIIVRDGTYSENVDVNGPSLTIRSENGSASTVVQAANPNDSVFKVRADYVNISGFTVEGATGHGFAGISLYNMHYCNISNNNCSNNMFGISLGECSNNSIVNNTCSNNDYGIYLWDSINNSISSNICYSNNEGGGIHFGDSISNTIANNNCTNNMYGGISFYNSSDNRIVNNTVNSNDDDGISLDSSNNNSIANNTANMNKWNGILLYYSNNNSIRNNNALNNYEEGIHLRYSSGNKLTKNNASRNDYGIYLEYSSNNKLNDNNANLNNVNGISLTYSSNNNTLTKNNANLNKNIGINLYKPSNNTLVENNASSNNKYGIRFYSSSANTIYLNNFINNTDNVYSYNSTNIWNSTSKITYTYNGNTYTNYLGNYWDDYKEKYPDAEEVDGTGIWNTPCSIDSDNDSYPLVKHFENYVVPSENIFDTGASANPYPSIRGLHNGTITPNQAITVQKLYTYPCAGTGGHTEYARIWNKTIGEYAVAEWNGYIGDYLNISFNKTLTLKEGVIYNYTIRTGSYPQIIHESAFNTTGGTITCDKFIDANGKIYSNWIPAIRLE